MYNEALRSIRRAALLIFAAYAIPGAEAAVVLSNLGTQTGTAFSVTSGTYKAQAFRVSSQGSFEVNSVTLILANAANTAGNFFVAIYSGAEKPEYLVPNGRLSGSSNPATAGQYTYTSGRTLSLEPNTTYWIVAGVSQGAGQYRWVAAANNTYQTSAWTPDPRFGSSTGGLTTWTTGTGTTPNMFGIEASPYQHFYLIEKTQHYLQTSSAEPAHLPGGRPFLFSAGAEVPTALTLKRPNGELEHLGGSPEQEAFRDVWFATKGAMDAAYPAGVYQIVAEGRGEFVLDLSTDLFPAEAPRVTNGTWSDGMLIVNPTQATTLTLNAFPGYLTAGVAGGVDTDIYGLNDDVHLENGTYSIPLSPGEPAQMSPITSISIPANALTNGQVYEGMVRYSTLSTADMNTVGYTGAAIFVKTVRFYISARTPGNSPPPPVITTQPGSQSVNLGANATFSVGVIVGGSTQWTGMYVEWYRNGVQLETSGKYSVSANGASLTVNGAGAAEAGTYTARFTNAGGVAVTEPAALSVIPVTAQPVHQTASVGQSTTLTATAVAGTTGVQWSKDGTVLAGATNSSLVLPAFGLQDVGVYRMSASQGSNSADSQGAIAGLMTTKKLEGPGKETADILHPATGNIYDQILLQGPAAAVTTDTELGHITRISFVDLSDDIVQVEYFGPGTVTVSLDNATGPALAQNYNQPTVEYMKGHARIVIAGAAENSHLSIFSVGKLVNGNPDLYREGVTFDGFADIASISISSPSGAFGGLRAGNARMFSTKGHTGLYAPGVQFHGPVYINDITAADNAVPMLVIGSGADVRATGGDLFQQNGKPVQVAGISKLEFTAGVNSHGVNLPAQLCNGRLDENGLDVTDKIVVSP